MLKIWELVTSLNPLNFSLISIFIRVAEMASFDKEFFCLSRHWFLSDATNQNQLRFITNDKQVFNSTLLVFLFKYENFRIPLILSQIEIFYPFIIEILFVIFFQFFSWYSRVSCKNLLLHLITSSQISDSSDYW